MRYLLVNQHPAPPRWLRTSTTNGEPAEMKSVVDPGFLPALLAVSAYLDLFFTVFSSSSNAYVSLVDVLGCGDDAK